MLEFGWSQLFEFIEVFLRGIICDYIRAGIEGRYGGDAVSCADVEGCGWGEGAFLDKEFAEFVEGV